MSVRTNTKRVRFYRRVWLIFLVMAGLFLCGRAAGQALDRRPISPTAVPSSRDGGLMTTPRYGPYNDPTGEYGNLAVTGNVSGGRHFRGAVPYRSTSEFWGSMQTGTLNSFMRQSAGRPYTGRSVTVSEPFVLPSRRVTSLQGTAGAELAIPREQVVDQGLPAGLETQGLEQAERSAAAQAELREHRPVSGLGEELESFRVRDSYAESAEGEQLRPAAEQADELLAELKQELAEVKARARELDENFRRMNVERQELLQDEALKPAEPLEPEEDILKPAEPTEPFEQEDVEEPAADSYDRMLDELEADVYEQPATPAEQQEKREMEAPEAETVEPTEEQPSEGEQQATIKSSYGRTLLELRRSFAEREKLGYDRSMQAGREYMKEGRYYRAADVFDVAGEFMPENAAAYMGRARALFAAGEYVSSAYFLAKGLELSPALARREVDLVEVMGDRDRFENRLLDLQKWYRDTGSPELGFVAAYVALHSGREQLARQVIESAYEKMSDVRGVAVMKRAIETGRGGAPRGNESSSETGSETE